MNRTLINKLIFSIISLVIVQQLTLQGPILTNNEKELSLQEIAQQWQLQLSKQPQFESWKEATLTISPIGPGTHGWIVFVEHNKQTIGYMIIHSDFDKKYTLTEYGIGEPTALQFIKKHSKEWNYYDYFLQIITQQADQETVYIEPFMIEEYPITTAQLTAVASSVNHTKKEYAQYERPTLITGQYSICYFSPYDRMPWLTSPPLNHKFEDDTSIEVLIELGSQLTYTVNSWGSIFSTYSITGFHEWDEFNLYIKLDDEQELVSRYIPYDALMELGLFYNFLAD